MLFPAARLGLGYRKGNALNSCSLFFLYSSPFDFVHSFFPRLVSSPPFGESDLFQKMPSRSLSLAMLFAFVVSLVLRQGPSYVKVVRYSPRVLVSIPLQSLSTFLQEIFFRRLSDTVLIFCRSLSLTRIWGCALFKSFYVVSGSLYYFSGSSYSGHSPVYAEWI